MNHFSPEAAGSIPQPSEQPRNVPQGSEDFRTLPNHSETFGKFPKSSEAFGSFPQHSEGFRNVRQEAHIITVRDAAKMFEAAGVARTERSIVNWCRDDAMGGARLDAYFDPNERKYYITQQSIENAIAEEKAKAFRNNQPISEPFPKASEAGQKEPPSRSDDDLVEDSATVEKLKQQIIDLKIINSGKDYVIKTLSEERKDWLQQLKESSTKIGELKTQLLQLGQPADNRLGNVRNDSEDPIEHSFNV